MKKTDKSLLIFILTLLTVTTVVVIVIIFFMNNRYKINAELSDLAWPNGPILLVVSQSPGDESVNEVLPPGDYIYSSDGKIYMAFADYREYESTVIYDQEFISPTKLLVSGELKISQPEVNNKTGLYWVETDKITAINSSELDDNIHGMSLSPSQKYLRYNISSNDYVQTNGFGDEKFSEILCVSTFSLETLGECVDLNKLLPEKYQDKEQYFTDSNWLMDEDIYVLTIKSKLESHEEPSPNENQPLLLIQDEKARFLYNPQTNEFKEIDLKSNISLKTNNIFLNKNEELRAQYFTKTGDYETINDYKNSRVLIKEKSTGKKAKLSDVNYLGSMAGFDVNWWQNNLIIKLK